MVGACAPREAAASAGGCSATEPPVARAVVVELRTFTNLVEVKSVMKVAAANEVPDNATDHSDLAYTAALVVATSVATTHRLLAPYR